jgi:hypothetical protein
MKRWFVILTCISAALGIGLVSCKKDPYYSTPTAQFTGSLVYNGVPIGVANNGQGGNIAGKGANSVYFELFQPGYQLSGPIAVVVNQDGSFSDLLYDGSYKLSFPAGLYPFLPADADLSPVMIKGNVHMNINVTPYYTIDKETFSLSSGDSTVHATFDITQVITDTSARAIDKVSLYISRTSFVDDGANAAVVSLPGNLIPNLSGIQLSLKVPASLSISGAVGAATQNYLYVRLGIKTVNIGQLLYSDVQKLTFQ